MRKERYMTVLGGYKLDMHRHGHLVRETLPDHVPGKDYGADPVGDGTFRMVPSGDIVDFAERNRRLSG
jgi:hypothetical protein